MNIVTKYRMDLKSKHCTASLVFAALDLVWRLAYYFGFGKMMDAGFLNVLCGMMFPVVMMGAYAVSVRELKRNAPGLYGIGGSVFCVLAVLSRFSSGNLLLIVLALALYVCSALALLAYVGGYIPEKINILFPEGINTAVIIAACFWLCAGMELLMMVVTMLRSSNVFNALIAVSGAFGMLSIASFVLCLESAKGNK